MSYSQYYGGSGSPSEPGEIYTPPVPALSGVSDAVTLIVTQSNGMNHTDNTYTSTIGGEWTGTSVALTGMRNIIGYAFQKLGVLGKAYTWAKHSLGGTVIQEFSPLGADGVTEGTQYADVLAAEDLLYQEYGRIDLLVIFVGETNAATPTSEGDMVVHINAFINGLARTPKAILAIGPPNMSNVLDAQEAAIRSAYETVVASRPNMRHVGLATIDTDDDLDNNHIVREATADAASDLLVTGMLTLY